MTFATLKEAAQAVRDKKVSPRELVAEALRLAQEKSALNAFVHLNEAEALSAAEAAHSGPLAGVPLALKDLFLEEGIPTTAASKILAGYVPPYTATCVEKLRAAGGISIGKTNMDEFAMGSSNENSAYGPAKNPWDPRRTPGGSSGGSAAAVAAGIVYGALGTDTGGSIREPSSFSGIVGLKPTYGRVSRYGVIAFASSLDQPGPFARSVEDVALLLEAIAGHDPRDSTSAVREVPSFTRGIEGGVKGLRIGVPKDYFLPGMQREVEEAVRVALALYEKLGARLVEITLPHTKYAVSAYYVIATAECSSNLARYDGTRFGISKGREHGLQGMYTQTRHDGFGDEVKRRILLGTYVLSAGYYDAYYVKAQKVRTLLCRDFDTAFSECDVIIGPTTPFTAFALGEKTEDPLAMYLADVFTVSCNMAGLPGVSLPCGFDSRGLPIGLQVIGRHFDEAKVLQVARAYERETEWHTRRPQS